MKRHIFEFIILAIATVFAWYKILFQVFKGEGYTYFVTNFRDLPNIDKLVGHDAGPRLVFGLLETFFKDNFFLYQLFTLLTLITLSILLYLLVWEISRKKLTAFVAALLFSVSFNGTFEMIAIGNYQFFIQRVVFFLLLFPSGLFLVRFLRTRQERHFFLSVLFYVVSLYLSRYSIFFLPFLLNYLFVFIFFLSGQVKEKYRLALRALFYLIPTFVFLRLESQVGSSFLLQNNNNFFTFLIQERNTIIEGLQRQLTILLIPLPLLNFLLDSSQLFFSKFTINSLYLPSLISFIAIIAYSLRRYNTAKVPIIAAALSIPMTFVLYGYTKGSSYAVSILSGDRSLFAPLIGYSIVFSFFFTSLLLHKNILLKGIGGLAIILLLYTNLDTIWRKIDANFYEDVAVKASLQYIRKISPTLSRDSFVVVPTNVGVFGAYFAERYYGKEETIFFPFSSDWPALLKRPFDPQKDIILEYDKGKKEVVDKTSQYAEILQQKYKK